MDMLVSLHTTHNWLLALQVLKNRLRKRLHLGFTMQLIVCQKMIMETKDTFGWGDFAFAQGTYTLNRTFMGLILGSETVYHLLRGDKVR